MYKTDKEQNEKQKHVVCGSGRLIVQIQTIVDQMGGYDWIPR